MKKIKRNNDKFRYPHPILKSFASQPQQQFNFNPSYSNYHKTDPNTISHKLLRSSHIYPKINSEFSLLLNPFHPSEDIKTFNIQEVLQCKSCMSYLNSDSISNISLMTQICKFCGSKNESDFNLGRYIDMRVMDILIQKTVEKSRRRLLFVIEANEYFYRNNIPNDIFECIKSIQREELEKQCSLSEVETIQDTQALQESRNLQIGLLLFNRKQCFILNLQSHQLVIFNPEQFVNSSDGSFLPVGKQQIFTQIEKINVNEIEEIVTQILYESHQLTTIRLIQVLSICNKMAKQLDAQSKIFAISHDNRFEQDCFNIQLDSRVQLSVFTESLLKNLVKCGLRENIKQFYGYDEYYSTSIYYDLYQAITEQCYYDVNVNVSGTSLITFKKEKTYYGMIKQKSPIILNFGVTQGNKGGYGYDAQCIQIRIGYTSKIRNNLTFVRQQFKKQRVITYPVPKIQNSQFNEVYMLNDETFFFVFLNRVLQQEIQSVKAQKHMKKKKVKNQIVQSVKEKCREIIKSIGGKDQFSDISIPKNLIHFFIYSFMVISDSKFQGIWQQLKFSKSCLEIIAKQVYPKVYEFEPELRNIKFKPKSFMENAIRLVDDGEILAVVVGDEVRWDILHRIFGIQKNQVDLIQDIHEIQIMQNQTNIKIRQAIQKIRDMNVFHFLRLRVVKLSSPDFQQLFGNKLYIDEEHRRFFLHLIKS